MAAVIGFTILIPFTLCISQHPLLAQACQDEEGMVKTSVKDLTDLVETVKKEKVTNFQSHYHQKSYLSKTTFLVGVVGGLFDCLNKAVEDRRPPKSRSTATRRNGKPMPN